MSNITVIGAGYVGLVTGACFSDLGNTVTCLDIDEPRIAGLNRGVLPIFEPGLKEMVDRNRESGRLRFTTDYKVGCPGAEFIFVAVNTPSGQEGEANIALCDLSARWIVGKDGYESRSSNSWCAGKELTGRVLMTLAGGQVAYRLRSFSMGVAA